MHMFQSIGIPGLIIILIITLIVFGPRKLPEIGAAFGKTLSEFKKSATGIMNSDEPEVHAKKKTSEDIQAVTEPMEK